MHTSRTTEHRLDEHWLTLKKNPDKQLHLMHVYMLNGKVVQK